MKLTVAGCGSLGSRIALGLARSDRVFYLIDDDRVESENILTSAYLTTQVSVLKVHALASLLYHKSRCESRSDHRTLRSTTQIPRSDLVIDTFDNADARRLTLDSSPLVHVGLTDDGLGTILWDRFYTWSPGPPRGESGICTHQLSLPLILLTSTVAINSINQWLESGEQTNWLVTASSLTRL